MNIRVPVDDDDALFDNGDRLYVGAVCAFVGYARFSRRFCRQRPIVGDRETIRRQYDPMFRTRRVYNQSTIDIIVCIRDSDTVHRVNR